MIFTNSNDSEPKLSFMEKSEIAEDQAIDALNECKELPKHKRIQIERLIRNAIFFAYRAGVKNETGVKTGIDTDSEPC